MLFGPAGSLYVYRSYGDTHVSQWDVRTRWSCRRGADPVRGGNRRRGYRLSQKARRSQTA
ncbi:hypothetical protein [Mycolicibacterium rhodesiae]|uniref:hypothetical protein n=1 Tax=Mycolicibacterium rhodesiae TaxID=36814 RepID=UPI003F5D13F0